MKKFKIIWTENDDGDLFQVSRIFIAEDEDAACDMWEEQVDNGYTNTSGIDDCAEVLEHPVENSRFPVKMPDGLTYLIPAIFVAKRQAQKEGKKVEEVLDLYEEDSYNMISFACRNIEWADIQRVSPTVAKEVSRKVLEDFWLGVHNLGLQVKL